MKYLYYYGLNLKPVVKETGLSFTELLSLSKNGMVAEQVIDANEQFFSIVKDGELKFHKRNISMLDFFNKIGEYR
jgi:hypothetical protein